MVLEIRKAITFDNRVIQMWHKVLLVLIWV